MGILTRIGNFVSSRRFSMLDYTGYSAGVPAYSVRDFQTLAKEGFSENAIAYACVDAITTAMAAIPWKVEKRTAADLDEWEPYPTHPLLDLLASPNVAQSGSEFTEGAGTYYQIGGNAYIVLIGMPLDIKTQMTSAPKGMLLPRPDFVRPVPDAMGMPQGFVVGKDRDLSTYHPSRVIHLKRFNPLDPIFGLAPMAVAGKDVDILNAISNYQYRLMRRSGRPDGVIITEGALKPDQYERLQKQVDDKFNNADKPGGWKLFEGIVKEIKEFAFKPEEMGLTKTQIDRIRAICAIYKVPPEIIGVSEAKTYNNYGEARTALYVEGVLPLMDKFKDKYNQRLMPFFSKTDRLTYDRSKIEPLQEDRDKKATRNREDFKAGIYTANEVRAKNGDKPATDDMADQRMLSFSMVPADELVADEATTAQDPAAAEDPADVASETVDPNGPKAAANKKHVNRAHVEIGMLRRDDSALPMCVGGNPEMMWRLFDTARVGYLRSSREIFAKEINADLKACSQAITKSNAMTEGSAATAVRDALEARRSSWQKAYKKVYMAVGLGFAEKVDAGLNATIGKKRKRIRAAADTWEARIAQYLLQVGGGKITDVTNTTRKRIMKVVADNYAAGNGADVTASAIESVLGTQTTGRALNIARTEVIAASNAGSDAAARAFGVPLNKDWLCTVDGRQRPDHEEAGSTQVGVPLDSAFQVGGYDMMFPGDSGMGAPAEEVCNCRCATAYAVADGGTDTGE